MQITIDIDKEKQKVATQNERDQFLTALFCACSTATADYGAQVDFSDSHHWIITFPDEYEPVVSALFQPRKELPTSIDSHTEKLRDVYEHPDRHHHRDMNELIRCCMVNGAIDGMLMEKHAGLGYNSNRRCDVMNGPCSCGGWH